MCSAEVALLTATACRAPQRSATALSKPGTAGPCVSHAEESTGTDRLDVLVGDVLPPVGQKVAHAAIASALPLIQKRSASTDIHSALVALSYSNPSGTLTPAPMRAGS